MSDIDPQTPRSPRAGYFFEEPNRENDCPSEPTSSPACNANIPKILSNCQACGSITCRSITKQECDDKIFASKRLWCGANNRIPACDGDNFGVRSSEFGTGSRCTGCLEAECYPGQATGSNPNDKPQCRPVVPSTAQKKNWCLSHKCDCGFGGFARAKIKCYTGNKPEGQMPSWKVQAGDRFSWMSDDQVQRDGWTACLKDNQAPETTEFIPRRGALRVDPAPATSIIIRFNMPIKVNSGTIILAPEGSSSYWRACSNTAGSNANGCTISVTDTDQVRIDNNLAPVPAGARRGTNPSTSELKITPTGGMPNKGGVLSVQMAAGVIQNDGGIAFAGLSASAYNFTVQDTLPPKVMSFSPKQGAQGVSSNPTISITFDEPVKINPLPEHIGIIVETGAPTRINILNSEANASGTTLTIRPHSTLAEGTEYKFGLFAFKDHSTSSDYLWRTVVEDVNNNPWKPKGDPDSATKASHRVDVYVLTTFTVSASAPVLVRQEAISEAGFMKLEMWFSQQMQKGTTGAFVLTPNIGTPVSIPVTSSQVQIQSGDPRLVFVNKIDVLKANKVNTTYTVTLAAGVLKGRGIAFGGIAAGTWSFEVRDASPPTIAAYSPAQGASAVTTATGAAPVVLIFDEPVTPRQDKNIVIKSTSTSTELMISVADGTQVTFSGTNVTIHTITPLSGGEYSLSVPNGVIGDLASNAFGGIKEGAYRFTIVQSGDSTSPQIEFYMPLNGTAGVYVGTGFSIILTFNEDVQKGTGHIRLQTSAESRDISISNQSQVTITGSDVYIRPASALLGAAHYTITMGSGVLQDTSGNAFAGIADSSYSFTTGSNIANTSAAPSIVTNGYRPANNTALTSATIRLTFTKTIIAGTGSITIAPYSTASANSTVIPISDAQQITILGTILNIHPNPSLSNIGVQYVLTMPSGTLRDTETTPHPFAGISGMAYTFTVPDTANPTIESFSPTNGNYCIVLV